MKGKFYGEIHRTSLCYYYIIYLGIYIKYTKTKQEVK